jgi:hypothetical protein
MARPVNDFFIYQVNFLLLGAAAVVTQQLQFDASSDFMWYYGAYAADANSAVQTEATRTYPLVDVLITPTDTSSQFSNIAVPVTSMFGNGENPFVLPAPRLIPARSSLTFQVTNRDAANTNLRLQLIGVKKYLG